MLNPGSESRSCCKASTCHCTSMVSAWIATSRSQIKRSFLQKLQRRDFQGHWPGRPYSCERALHLPCLVAADDQMANRKPVECPEGLRAAGNCILAALHHLVLPEQASSMASMTEWPEYMFFHRRRQRTYAQVAEKANLKIFPRFPPGDLTSKNQAKRFFFIWPPKETRPSS